MAKKILFTDMDDTMLRSDKTISERLDTCLHKMMEEGHYLVLNSGRPTSSIAKVAKQLGLYGKGCMLCGYNGSEVFDCESEKLLFGCGMDGKTSVELVHAAREAGLYIQGYQNGIVLSERDCDELYYYVDEIGIEYKIVDDLAETLKNGSTKMLLIDLDETGILTEFLEKMRSWEAGRTKGFFSRRKFLEYVNPIASKGYALKCVCEILGIPVEDSIAAGDEENDISMIIDAGLGVAVQNARDNVKAIADLVTDADCDHDALADVIDKYILEK